MNAMDIIKETSFVSTRLEVCRHCQGTGQRDGKVCPTCGGQRIVRKTIEGKVTVQRLSVET